jgi:hypothetical protein
MEARWAGESYKTAIAHAIPEGTDLEEYDCAKLAALLAGYYDRYGKVERSGYLNPEVEFTYVDPDMPGSFILRGKIDNIGTMADGHVTLIESKTTGESIFPESDYWTRLKFNAQVYQYVCAGREHLGYDISKIFYDTTRKPSINPKEIVDLDENGKKIVEDANGVRQFKKNGEPVQGGDKSKGWEVRKHQETPDEYCERLYQDTKLRPDFYFCRKEVPVIDDQVESFKRHRIALAGMITHLRESEGGAERNPEAWPRHVDHDTCFFCDYKSFCLSNLTVDPNRPPEGFSIQQFNVELSPPTQTKTHEQTAPSTPSKLPIPTRPAAQADKGVVRKAGSNKARTPNPPVRNRGNRKVNARVPAPRNDRRR